MGLFFNFHFAGPRGGEIGFGIEGRGVVISPAAEGDQARAARVWLHRARLEWASVPSFCELAEQLEACGAPRELGGRARQAAHDELRHAAVSAAVGARLIGAIHVSLDPSAPDQREVARGGAGLSRLAVESWTDGCLGEAVAADLALMEASQTTDPAIRQAQLMIASDEARHAALAWDVLEWTLSVDRSAVRQVLPVTEPTPAAAHNGPTLPSLHHFGITAPSETASLRQETERRARNRLSERLRA